MCILEMDKEEIVQKEARQTTATTSSKICDEKADTMAMLFERVWAIEL